MPHRREFLKSLAGLTVLSQWSSPATGWLWGAEPSRDISWLSEVTTPPATLPEADRPLAPLFPNAEPTLESWKARREELHRGWLEFLGPLPERPTENSFEVLEENRPRGCVRQLVRYRAEADELVEGYLLRPAAVDAERLPGIIALHQTSNESIREIAGVSGEGEQSLGLQVCRAGFVVFCPRNYLWQTPPEYRINTQLTVDRLKKRHPELRGMGKMLFDAQRGVDILASLPEVDPQRIGAIGHSLGAKEVLYLQAFDERIRVGVASEVGIANTSTNWNSPWYLGEECRAADFPWQHHQLLALCAPRPLLILGGEQGPGAADGLRSWPYLVAAQPAWKTYGTTVKLGLLNHGLGHSLPADVRMKAIEWLKSVLG